CFPPFGRTQGRRWRPLLEGARSPLLGAMFIKSEGKAGQERAPQKGRHVPERRPPCLSSPVPSSSRAAQRRGDPGLTAPEPWITSVARSLAMRKQQEIGRARKVGGAALTPGSGGAGERGRRRARGAGP